MSQKAQVLDLAMNLNRVGNWAADGYSKRKRRIKIFLDETSRIIKFLNSSQLPISFKQTFEKFLQEYNELEKAGKKGPKDESEWAERMMTWGNILTHRSKFLTG